MVCLRLLWQPWEWNRSLVHLAQGWQENLTFFFLLGQNGHGRGELILKSLSCNFSSLWLELQWNQVMQSARYQPDAYSLDLIKLSHHHTYLNLELLESRDDLSLHDTLIWICSVMYSATPRLYLCNLWLQRLLGAGGAGDIVSQRCNVACSDTSTFEDCFASGRWAVTNDAEIEVGRVNVSGDAVEVSNMVCSEVASQHCYIWSCHQCSCKLWARAIGRFSCPGVCLILFDWFGLLLANPSRPCEYTVCCQYTIVYKGY